MTVRVLLFDGGCEVVVAFSSPAGTLLVTGDEHVERDAYFP
jgi:hypothetical protein